MSDGVHGCERALMSERNPALQSEPVKANESQVYERSEFLLWIACC